MDGILHAGDIVGVRVIDELEKLAPVYAVLGNNDGPTKKIPARRAEEFDGVRIAVLHDIGKPDKLNADARSLIAEEKPQVLVSGHSHKPHALVLNGILFVNPGSAGPRRFKLPRAAGWLEIARKDVTATVVSIETGQILCRATLPR